MVAIAGVVADPLLRRAAAGLPAERWTRHNEPADPPLVLGVATGLVAALLVVAAEPAALAVPGAGLAPVMTLASAVDLRHHRLPDRLTMPATLILAGLVVVAAALAADVALAARAGLGAVALGAILLVVHLVSPSGMGFGDVKLGVPLGLVVGASWLAGVVVALAVAAVAGAVAGVVVAVRHRDRHHAFPFGPCLCFGAVTALLVH